MKKSRWLAVALFGAFFFEVLPARAQIGQAAALAGVANLSADVILNRADKSIANAINEAQAAGDGLLMNATNRASILEQDAILAIGDQRQKAFRDLDKPMQDLLVEMERWRGSLENFQKRVYRTEDTVNIDLNYDLQHLIFANVPFFVQAVHGTSFLKQPGGYKVTLLALNLGIQDGRRNDISVELGHTPVQIDTPDQSRINQAVITLPNAVLDSYFQPDHARTVSLVISIAQHNQVRKFPWITTADQVNTYRVPVTLTLYPDLAAQAKLTVSYAHFDWQSQGDVPGPFGERTPDKDGCHPERNGDCAYHSIVDMTVPSSHQTPAAEGDEHIVGARLDCSGGDGCAFVAATESPNIFDSSSHATIKYQTWSRPVQIRIMATVEKFTRRSSNDTMTIPTSIYFGRNTPVAIPPRADSVSIEVVSYGGKTTQFELCGSQSDPQALVSRVSCGDPNSPTRTVTITAAPHNVTQE